MHKKNLTFREIADLEFPIVVQLQTISTCNARCIMCPYTKVAFKLSHGKMEKLLYSKIIDECAKYNVKEFKPFLMNEPFLDNRFIAFLKEARSKLPDTVIGFSTNGSRLDVDTASELAQIGLNEVWFNYSGNKKETFEKVMDGLSYDAVTQNIINFSKFVSKYKSDTKVCISMVEIKDCLNEIEESKFFWKQYNIEVHPIPYNNRGGNSQEIGIKVLGNPIGKRICDKPTNKICILYNGDVILCPSDWERKNILGNVSNKSIKDIWRSPERKLYIDKIMDCDYEEIELCKNCDFPILFD